MRSVLKRVWALPSQRQSSRKCERVRGRGPMVSTSGWPLAAKSSSRTVSKTMGTSVLQPHRNTLCKLSEEA